jgi:hypothetical protein
MWTYNPKNQCYIDSFNDFHSKHGGDDRDKVQKDITGSDLSQLKEYTALIGDCLLMVPPTSIRLVSQTASQRTSLIRSKGAITKTIPKVERIIEMQLYFNGEASINGIEYEQTTPNGTTMVYHMNGLRALIAQFKFCPYLPITNKYINEVLNVEAVGLNSIQINTVPGFPRTLQATIRLTDFEYRQFMPEILPPNIDQKEDFTDNLFAKTIHFPVMRYYYQRAIQNGEAANLLEYNSEPYLEATLGQKTVLQPMKFDTPLIDFYVANEEFLKMRKQLKEALEKKPFETIVTYTDTEKAFLKEVAKMYTPLIQTLYAAQQTAQKINSEEGLYYVPYEKEVLDIPFSDLEKESGKGLHSSSMKKESEIYSAYLQPIISAFNKFFADNNTFDHTIIKEHNVIMRENSTTSDSGLRVSFDLKLVIDWNRASSTLESKLKQDYGKVFSIDTKKLLVNSAFSIGFVADFKKVEDSHYKFSTPFAMQAPKLKSTDIDYSNADISLLSKLSNDFSSTIEDGTKDLIGNDLFSQNQELAKMKDNIDLESGTSMMFDKFPIYNCIVDSVSVVYNNNFTKFSLNSMHGYASQYIGASDTIIEVNLKTKDQTVVNLLQALPRQMAELLINYRKIMTCSPLRIDCEIARFAGINEVIIESIDTNTVPGFPGLYQISLRLVSVDRTLRNREALKKIDVDTSVTNNDNSTMTQNFFELKNRLKKVELYPDLELPLITDLEKLGYYFIRYKTQAGRLFPDADFYFVYLHAYTAEMLKESIVQFFNESDSKELKHQILDDLTGTSKDVSLFLSEKDDKGNIIQPKKLITKTSSDGDDAEATDEYDKRVEQLYSQAEAAFSNSMKYVTHNNEKQAQNVEDDLKNKNNALLSLQESLSASNYATYDFNHQIKIATKDNVAFKESLKQISSGLIKIVTADGTHDEEDADDVVGETNNSLKHLIKNVLKNPITTEESLTEIVRYIAIDVLGCEGLTYKNPVSSDNPTVLSGKEQAKSDAMAKATDVKLTAPTASTQNAIDGNNTNNASGSSANAVTQSSADSIVLDILDFFRNKLRVALSSAATGKNSVLDFDKKEQTKNVDNWIGTGSLTFTDSDGNDKSVPNVLKTLNGQGVSSYVIAEDGDDKYNGIVFGPFGIKKYDPKYLGRIFNSPNFAGSEGFIDPYYNKDTWNIFFADEIAAGDMEPMTEDRTHDYIDIISNKDWDNKTDVTELSKSSIAIYRILLVWFYKLLDDENNSMLPNAFFYIKNVVNTLNGYSNSSDLGFSYLANKKDPRTWFARGFNWLQGVTAEGTDYLGSLGGKWSIFGTNSKALVEQQKEMMDKEGETSASLETMKSDLKNGLIITQLNLVAGLFTTLGALSVGEFDTPILPAVTGGNLSDYTSYIENIKASYLDYDSLNQIDVKMRRFFSYLDVEEYNNKTAWNQKVDPLKKYSITSLIQRKYLTMAEIPQIYMLHSFYDMVAHDMRGRMARAFPTYYMLLIDEGRDLGMWHLQDNFYDVSSISEFQVVKSRKIAADTANITMTNLFGTYTSEDEDMKDEYQYTFKDAWNSIFSPRPFYAKEYNRRQNAREFNRAKIKPGARIHLRMGYEADASKIPIMFNGCVAEVQTVDDMINIICQGDGVELANPDMFNAADADDVADLKYTEKMFGGLYGMFNSETTPRDLLVNPLISSGTWIRSIVQDWSNSRFFNDNPFGIVHFGDKYYHEVFQNSGEMEQNIYEALNKPSWGSSGEANFNESLWAMETAPKIQVGLEGKKSYWDLMNIAASVSPEYISAVVPFQMRSSVFHGAPRYYCAYDYEKTAESKIVEKRKPFQQYHVYTSYSDIIANKVAASDKEIKTCAVGIYKGNGWLTTTNKSVGPMWLDIDIYPEKQKMTVINCDFTHRSFDLPFTIPVVSKVTEDFSEDQYKVAWRATANGLKETVKDMYTGELIVLGDPAVKPYDKMFVYDLYTDIQGTFDIEAVVQTFSVDTGYTTSITPDCVVAVDDKYEKIAHNTMKSVLLPVLTNTFTLAMLSQRFANVTRSMFFAAGQAINGGTKYATEVVNGVKTAMGSEDVAAYGGMAEKVLGKVAPIFGATATDFTIYSSIDKLTKAYKAIPTSHDVKSANDLVKFLTDIKNQKSALGALDTTNLKTQLETALEETSKFSNIGSDAGNLAQGTLNPDGTIGKTTTSTAKIEQALKDLESYTSTYIKGTNGISSMEVNKDLIDNILEAVPEAKRAELSSEIAYLEKINGNVTLGSQSFEETMTKLIKVANTVNPSDLTAESKLLKSVTDVDKTIFVKPATTLESFGGLGETLAEVNTVKKGAGAIKAFLSSNALWLAAQIVLTKYAQEYLERKLKNLQVLTVFPVMKNGLVMTAGLDGNKGSVFDSPTYNQPGFIEEMAGNFFDGKYGTALPLILECLVNTTDMREIVDNYKRDPSQQNGSEEVLSDSYTNKLLTATTLKDVSGAEAYRQMFLVPRVASATDNDAKVAFAKYKLVDIPDPATNGEIDSNLAYIFINDYLRQFNDPKKDKNRQVLFFAAQQNESSKDSDGNEVGTYTMDVKSSSEGTKDLTVKCKKIEQGEDKLPVYDIPMVRKDAISTLTTIVKAIIDTIQPDATSDNSTLDELHKHNIIIHNATRVNEKTSWFCTGYSFSIEVKDYDNFGNLLEKMHKDQPKISDSNGNLTYGWNYKQDTSMGANTYIVMVMPPK